MNTPTIYDVVHKNYDRAFLTHATEHSQPGSNCNLESIDKNSSHDLNSKACRYCTNYGFKIKCPRVVNQQ